MNCINNDLIQKYLDGEIHPDEKVRIENHLKKCTYCADRLEQQRKRVNIIKTLLDDLADEEVVRPPLSQIVNEFMPLLESPNQKSSDVFKTAWPWKRRLMYGLCGACAVVLVLLYPLKNLFDKPQKVIQMQTMVREVDANRPFSDQETVISVIDPDGNVTYLE